MGHALRLDCLLDANVWYDGPALVKHLPPTPHYFISGYHCGTCCGPGLVPMHDVCVITSVSLTFSGLDQYWLAPSVLEQMHECKLTVYQISIFPFLSSSVASLMCSPYFRSSGPLLTTSSTHLQLYHFCWQCVCSWAAPCFLGNHVRKGGGVSLLIDRTPSSSLANQHPVLGTCRYYAYHACWWNSTSLRWFSQAIPYHHSVPPLDSRAKYTRTRTHTHTHS